MLLSARARVGAPGRQTGQPDWPTTHRRNPRVHRNGCGRADEGGCVQRAHWRRDRSMTGIWPTGDGRWCVVGTLAWECGRSGSNHWIAVLLASTD